MQIIYSKSHLKASVDSTTEASGPLLRLPEQKKVKSPFIFPDYELNTCF